MLLLGFLGIVMTKQAKFNRDQVIEKAKNLYWEKGYHATSMRNLQEVIDMRPGSIYAAFGSKDNLFKESLSLYAKQNMALLTDCLSQETTILLGLKRFITHIIIADKDRAPNGMCMIVKSIAELTESDSPELLHEATTILSQIEATFSELFQQSINNGEFSTDKTANELARFFQVQIIGLRTYARTVKQQAVIEKLLDDLFTDLQTSR